MTLIAFACSPDRAEMITDTTSYTPNYRHIGKATKFLPLPHLDTVVLAQGANTFTAQAKIMLANLNPDVGLGFDDVVTLTPGWLRGLRDHSDAAGVARFEASIFLVGYSQTTAAFEAHAFHSDDDFEPHKVEGLFVMPSPFAFRPSALETRRMLAETERGGALEPARKAESLDLISQWQGRPLPPTPASAQEWRAVGLAVRRDRAVQPQLADPWLNLVIGGDIIHTVLERDRVTSTKIHTFDDTGEEFAQIVRGSDHPISQLGPCRCGSGRTYLECHLAKHRDEPCDCSSGKKFRDCCMVTPDTLE